jgi:hypothetical protein
MANGIEEFNAERNLARVTAGFKGGPFFATLPQPPAKSFVEGWPTETVAKLQHQGIAPGNVIDPWNQRRSK